MSSIPDEDPLMAALQTYFFVGSLVPDRICGSLEVRERSVNMFRRVARVRPVVRPLDVDLHASPPGKGGAAAGLLVYL